MTQEEATNLKNAVRDGVLIDVSHLAKQVGLLCPTFITSAFWNSVEISRSEKLVQEVIDMAEDVHELIGAGKFATLRFGVSTSGPWGIGIPALVHEFDGLGTAVVIGDHEEDLDFRTPRSGHGGFFTV